MSTPTEMNGTDVLLLVETPSGSGNFVAVGSQRNVNVAEASAPIDFSSKNQREYVGKPGRYTSTISLEHLYVPTQSGYARLKAANRAGEMIKVQIDEDGAIEEADAFVTNIGKASPDQAPVVVSVDLQVSGAWSTPS